MKPNLFKLSEGVFIQPTKEKIRLDSNQIKRQYFKEIESSIPDIFDETDEKGKTIWVNVGDGFMWFEKPYKRKIPNIFVPKNKMNKMYEFAIINKNLKI